MKLEAYIFTINKNNGYKLDQDELKDVKQEIDVYLTPKNYNDELIRKSILWIYQQSVKKKIRQEQLVTQGAYLENFDSESAHEVEQKRRAQLGKLVFKNKTEQKVIELLVSGYTYPEIRKKLRLSSKKLRNIIYQIRQQNAAK